MVVGLLFSWLVLLAGSKVTVPGPWMISLITMGPVSGAILKLKVLVVVIVLVADASPRIIVPPAVPGTKPFETNRLVLVILIGPANVKFQVSPVPLSIARPV